MSDKVVFISHDASRTGAPIVLLHLLRWIKNNTTLGMIVVLKNGGELEKSFQDLAETYVWNSSPHTRANRILAFINRFRILSFFKRFFPSDQQQYLLRLKQFQPDLIYANTVVSSDLGLTLSKMLDCPLICHIHELEVAINRYFGKDNFNRVKYSVDQYIAVSNAVKDNLLLNHTIIETRINKINAFIPAVEYAAGNQAGEALRRKYNIPLDAVVIGGCGTIDWRKSPDLFVQVAGAVSKRNIGQSVYFVWIGGNLQSVEYNHLKYDIAKLGLDNVVFLGEKDVPIEYFKMFDIFLLTSREDPYPLVCLEAASLSKPVVCFEGAGGMPEFVDHNCGFVIPYLDVENMADRIIQLITDNNLRNQLGQNACIKVKEQHDIAVSSRKIFEFMHVVVKEYKQAAKIK